MSIGGRVEGQVKGRVGVDFRLPKILSGYFFNGLDLGCFIWGCAGSDNLYLATT